MNYHKDASLLKNNKNSSHDKRFKKDIEKEEKIKNEKCEQNLTTQQRQ